MRVSNWAWVLCIAVACGDDDATNPGSDGGASSRDANDARDTGLSGPDSATTSDGAVGRDSAVPIPIAVCEPSGGSSEVAEPVLMATLFDRWHEAWQASPAVADLDGDGTSEILVARHNLLLGWHADESEVFRADVEDGRIWSSPVVADFRSDVPGLEVAVAARDTIHLYDSTSTEVMSFTWQDELRSLAAGDIDGDGLLELVAVSTRRLEQNNQRDILIAVKPDGSMVPGFPPNTTGAAGCDDACYVTGGYDQNIALGDVNDDGAVDIFATQDNAYLSVHDGTGRAFDAADLFEGRSKVLGVRFLHDYAEAQMGWAPNEDTANQAHFTNSAPAIADVDGDGVNELIVLGSVQNAAQSDRLRGVALWVFRPDGTRLDNWVEPFHAPGYLAGLWDFDGTNVVGATNQVSVADFFSDRDGPEMVFAGFDGAIHCVDARAEEVWAHTYTADDRVLTGGVVIADLSGDGTPEIVFNTYSPDEGKSELIILDAGGTRLHAIALPGRGCDAGAYDRRRRR